MKYKWTTTSEQSLNQSLIGTSVMVGLTVGAMIGGKVMLIGRRKTMIIFNLVGMVGVTMTLI